MLQMIEKTEAPICRVHKTFFILMQVKSILSSEPSNQQTERETAAQITAVTLENMSCDCRRDEGPEQGCAWIETRCLWGNLLLLPI